jgi:IS30 family transposase
VWFFDTIKEPTPSKEELNMYYKQLNEKKKAQIDILLEEGLSMRKAAKILNISHSTISRYKANKHKGRKRKIDIHKKYEIFLNYLYEHYDRRNNSIEVCVYMFRKRYPYAPSVSVKQVYNWINQGKIDIKRERMCYKVRKSKSKASGMMKHVIWNINNKTVLPISLRPKYIEKREEVGHLEIDSVIGKRNEYPSIITIVDRCTRRVWLIKAEYKNEYYINNLIYNYLLKNNVKVKSITTDNGIEFSALGITAKKLGVKLYKCDPYCSFQRGTNERMNAIVRRYIPKGRSLKLIPQWYLDDIAFNINSMPRKIFDFKCSYDVELNYIKNGALEISI